MPKGEASRIPPGTLTSAFFNYYFDILRIFTLLIIIKNIKYV